MMKRTLLAWWRSFLAALFRLRLPSGGLGVVLLLGMLLFWLSGQQPTPLRALVYSINLVTLQVTPDALPRAPLLESAALVIMFGGLLALAGGAANLIEYIRDPKLRQMAMASTHSNHVVVCGIGRVGYRVIGELIELGDSVVAINQVERPEWNETLARLGVPVIIGDARQRSTLLAAGVDRAAALISCTSDDLTNLDVALDAREIQPNIKIVLRMFDQKLAEKVSRGFNIKTAFSVSALAAPALAAAATRARVTYSFKLDGNLLNVVTVTFVSGMSYVGKTIKQLEDETQCSVIGKDRKDSNGDGVMHMNPAHDHVIMPGDRLHIIGPLASVRRLTSQ
jgi:Trk K+ transport system NAD-binding subunit